MRAVRGFDFLGVPVPLLGACIGGVALVMATLLFPAPDFREVEEAGQGWVKAAGASRRTLPVRARPPIDRGETTTADPEALFIETKIEEVRIEALRERAAANILLRSGFILSASEVRDDQPPRTIRYTMVTRTASGACAALPAPAAAFPVPETPPVSETTTSPPAAETTPNPPMAVPIPPRTGNTAFASNLALAAVAVEKTYRNPAQRWLELGLARLTLATLGRLPDLSLGPAQLRPSTIRALPAEVIGEPYATSRDNDVALLALLADECSALRLAAAVFFDLLAKQPTADTARTAEVAAARYAGRAKRKDKMAVIDYPPIVAAASEILVNE